jgi:hypothetical protein
MQSVVDSGEVLVSRWIKDETISSFWMNPDAFFFT